MAIEISRGQERTYREPHGVLLQDAQISICITDAGDGLPAPFVVSWGPSIKPILRQTNESLSTLRDVELWALRELRKKFLVAIDEIDDHLRGQECQADTMDEVVQSFGG